MAAKGVSDQFANSATIVCTESAAATLTYKKLETGISLFDKVAWLVNRIEYFLGVTSAILNTDADSMTMALSVVNTLSTIASSASWTDPALLDYFSIRRVDLGAAASGFFAIMPYVKDFGSLPGGGLLIPPSPLYGAIQGVGSASAMTGVIKLHYTNVVLTPDQYWELVESRRSLSS